MDDEIRTPAGDGEGIDTPAETPESPADAETPEADPLARVKGALTELDGGLPASAPTEVPAPAAEELAPAPEAPSTEISPEERAAAALAERYRGLPGVVPELIGGATVEEVTASLDASRRAFEAA